LEIGAANNPPTAASDGADADAVDTPTVNPKPSIRANAGPAEAAALLAVDALAESAATDARPGEADADAPD
jgi:hypothetical protein